MKNYFLLLACVIIVGCNNGHHKKDSDASQNSGDSSFKKISENFIAGYLAWRPQTATALGFHEYDGRITDLSKPSLDSELARLKRFRNQLNAFDTSSLSAKMFYDYRILLLGIHNEIFSFMDMDIFHKNPMVYAGAIDVNIYIKRNFAPLEERIKSIINIENKTPEVIAAAKANLNDSLAKPYIETAIEIARGSASFFKGDLVTALKDVKNDSLMSAFNDANKKAIDQINAYADYLQKEKLPKANNHFAIGKKVYAKMLLYQENLTISPEQILQTGLKELKKEQDVFNAAANIINPNKKPVDVYHDLQKEHPTAESLIPDAKKNIEAIRQFIIDKQIVTIPSEVRVNIKETPQYARSTSSASMDTPGPFEKVATEAYYYITPVEPAWTATQKEDWLAQFNYYTTDNVTIHEAYPGHYTQFLHLSTSPATNIEKIFGSYAYIEGWAHYCEKMLADEGYGSNGDSIKAAKYRLAQSGDALLRLCRLCVSVKMHCEDMSVDEATKFFMDNWYQGDKPSRQEALRGTYDPGYLFYTVGKLEILKLRDDYQKQEGTNFSLKKFNDLMLDNGMPPIGFLRERLLKNKSDWKNVL